MILMILKMSAVTSLFTLLTLAIWFLIKKREMTLPIKLGIGLIYGLCAVLSTHYGIDYSHMMLNVRDLGPLTAGLFFDPISGVIAGLIGGIERYIAGTYWGVGSYTRIACSVSTCLAGFLSAFLHIFVFKRKKPSTFYAFFMGAVMEVFHMYVVFITHRDDMSMAFYVVKTCSGAMIIFTGLGLAFTSVTLRKLTGESHRLQIRAKGKEVEVSHKFQFWLFIVTMAMLSLNFAFAFVVQTQSAMQDARNTLISVSQDIRESYNTIKTKGLDVDILAFHMGSGGSFDIINRSGNIVAGDHMDSGYTASEINDIRIRETDTFFTVTYEGTEYLCRTEDLDHISRLFVRLPMKEIYENRDSQAYETVFADIILFTVIYVLISMLVQSIVVGNLQMVNKSLNKITNGNLDERVEVYSSSEFASLSDDINQTVTVLKGYIEAAEKRIEQELEFARTIQESALPKNFTFPRNDLEIYATMDPAKEVGGDFYDFFFIDKNKVALVIADVSGKGIPASLFMMRSKTAVRSVAENGKHPAEVFEKANHALCEGNDANMFVTVWIGVIDLTTGLMQCANAGHEYPALMRKGGSFELYKQKHSPALASYDGLKFRSYELQLQPGDTLFVYTDGIPEAIDVDKNDYGTDRLLNALNSHKDEPLSVILPSVRKDIADFVGEADQFDDVTMLGFRYLGQNAENAPSDDLASE